VQSLEAKLKKEGIIRFKEDLRILDSRALRRAFGAKKSRRIILTKLMKSIIWQAYERIQSKEDPPFVGNLRTFWYQYTKPVLAHISDDDHAKTDPYTVMIRCFQAMVMEDKFFKYKDFDFTDENWENRRIGEERPELLIFSEKTGWFRLLRRWHERWSVSVLALGGFPSALSSEYTVEYLKPRIGRKKVRLIGIVDYDPSGAQIAVSFAEQLRSCGLRVHSPKLLIHPEHYSQQEIDIYSFPLPKNQRKKTENWMNDTGGVNGKPFGLESESMPHSRIESLLEKHIKK